MVVGLSAVGVRTAIVEAHVGGMATIGLRRRPIVTEHAVAAKARTGTRARIT